MFEDIIEEQREEDDFKAKHSIPINLTYPNSDEFDYTTQIEVIDLDLECKLDIEHGRGFEISKPKNSNKKEAFIYSFLVLSNTIEKRSDPRDFHTNERVRVKY